MDYGLVGDRWSVIATLALSAVNSAMGFPQYTHSKAALQPAELISIASQLAVGKYSPPEWFSQGVTPAQIDDELWVPVPLDPAKTYSLPALKGGDKRTTFLSIRSGGVVYESPFWFIVSAYSVGKTHRLFMIPRGKDDSAILGNQSEALKELAAGDFHPEKWLAEAAPIQDGFQGLAMFKEVTGSSIAEIEFSGQGTIISGGHPESVTMFQYDID